MGLFWKLLQILKGCQVGGGGDSARLQKTQQTSESGNWKKGLLRAPRFNQQFRLPTEGVGTRGATGGCKPE